MSFTNTPERYGVISAALHWISAIIVYGALLQIVGGDKLIIPFC